MRPSDSPEERAEDGDDDASQGAGSSDGEPLHADVEDEPAIRSGDADGEDDHESVTADEFAASVADMAGEDPIAAGDRIGDLLAVAREHGGDVRDEVGEALNLIGFYRPAEFEVWIDDLVALAESDDAELAFFGLRAIAQLAATNSRAAAKGLDATFVHLDDDAEELRKAALSIVAEVGATDPESVQRADRFVAAALRDSAGAIRLAGAITAGRLLGADPTQFPRTATELLSTIDDPSDDVREYALVALAYFAREHPGNVPEKKKAITALLEAEDGDLGLRRGTTDEALAGLLRFELDIEV